MAVTIAKPLLRNLKPLRPGMVIPFGDKWSFTVIGNTGYEYIVEGEYDRAHTAKKTMRNIVAEING